MATDVVMPRLSDSMEEGTILKWLVSEGDEVKHGQEIVEIETDKANMTYEADTDGALIEIVAQEGDTLPIGEVIARIGEAGEAEDRGQRTEDRDEGADAEEEPEAQEPQAEEAEPEPEKQTETATKEREPAGAPEGGNGRIKASPVARRMARDMGVELARLEGSGPGGRIVKADVEAAAKSDGAPAEPAVKKETAEERPGKAEAGAKGEAEVHELSRLQQTVSRRMAESKATAPDFALTLDVDMTKAVELRQRLKEVADPPPSFNDMVVKAAAQGAQASTRA